MRPLKRSESRHGEIPQESRLSALAETLTDFIHGLLLTDTFTSFMWKGVEFTSNLRSITYYRYLWEILQLSYLDLVYVL